MSTLPAGPAEVLPSVEPLNYSIDATCRRLGVSRQTIYRLRDRGLLTIYKFGSRSLVTAADVNNCQQLMLKRKLPSGIRGATV